MAGKYSEEQINEIIMGIRSKVDTSIYTDINYSAAQMRELRIGLQQGIDVSKYSYSHLPVEHMKEIRMGMLKGLDMGIIEPVDGKRSQFTPEQAKEIRLGMENNQEVVLYANSEYSPEQMKEIRLGQKAGIDASMYANPAFTDEQMHDIRVELTIQKIIEKIKDTLFHLYENLLNLVKGETVRKNNELPPEERMSEKDIETIIDEKVNELFNQMYQDLDKNPSFAFSEMTTDQQAEAMGVNLSMDQVVNQYLDSEMIQLFTEYGHLEEGYEFE